MDGQAFSEPSGKSRRSSSLLLRAYGLYLLLGCVLCELCPTTTPRESKPTVLSAVGHIVDSLSHCPHPSPPAGLLSCADTIRDVHCFCVSLVSVA